MATKAKQKQNTRKKKQSERLHFIVLIPMILVFFIPMIVRSYAYETQLDMYDWFSGSFNVDFFLHCKDIAIYIMIFIMIWYFIGSAMLGRFPKFDTKTLKQQWIPIGVYLILALLSSIFAQNKSFAFLGGYEQFEGFFVLLGYGLFVYYAFFYINNTDDAQFVLNFSLIATGIIALIGTFQFFKMDLFRTDFGQNLITDPTLGELQFNMELGRSYTTLYNPNYIGAYATLLFPVIITLFFVGKNLWVKLSSVIVLLCLAVTLIGSGSKAGILTLGFTLLLLCIMYHRFFTSHKGYLFGGIAALILLVIAVWVINPNQIRESVLKELGFMENDIYEVENEINISRIASEEDHVVVEYNNKYMEVFYDDEEVFVTDETGTNYEMEMDDTGVYRFEDSDLSGLRIDWTMIADGSMIPELVTDAYAIPIYQAEDGSYMIVNDTGVPVYYDSAQIKAHKPLVGHDKMISGRGYIWKLTIPRLVHNLVWGCGPDNFVTEFPNDDLLGKNCFGYANKVITKPHSLYLQVATQTGLLSLVALLAFLGFYVVNALKLLWNSDLNDDTTKLAVGILIGVLGYLITGLTNDSSVTVAPVFYLLVGIGIRLNFILKGEE